MVHLKDYVICNVYTFHISIYYLIHLISVVAVRNECVYPLHRMYVAFSMFFPFTCRLMIIGQQFKVTCTELTNISSRRMRCLDFPTCASLCSVHVDTAINSTYFVTTPRSHHSETPDFIKPQLYFRELLYPS